MWSDWTDWQNLQTPDAISITFPQTTIVSTTSVILHWATNNPSYIYIWYYDGAGVEHDLSFDSTYTTSGSVTITGLKAGRTSLFYFDAVDSYGQENGDPVLTVKMPTVATTASQIKSGYDGTLCHVSWQTSDSSIGALSYGFTNQLGHTVVETSSGTAHEVTFSCSVGQTIYYQVSGQGATQYTSAITKFLVPSLENVFDQELPLPLPIMRPIPGGSRRM